MERADKAQITICNGCGTVPVYNENQNLFVCTLCDGPVNFIGTNSTNIEILPSAKKSIATMSVVEMPYATKLLADELQTFMNMGLRILTGKNLTRLGQPNTELPKMDEVKAALARPLPERVMPETRVPEFREAPPPDVKPAEEDLYAMGVIQGPVEEEEEEAAAAPQTPQFGAQTPQFGAQTPQFGAQTPEYAPQTPQYGAQTPPYGAQTPNYAPQTPTYAPVTPDALATQAQEPAQVLYNANGDPLYKNTTPQSGTPVQAQPVYQPVQPLQQPVLQQPMLQGQPMPPQQGGAFQYVIPQPIVYQAPIPQGPPTIVIDTSPQTMQQGGFMESYEQARQGQPVMGSFGAKSRHQTPRGRATSPPKKGVTFGGEPLSSGAKVTVNKLG